jgi:hypothetical protein
MEQHTLKNVKKMFDSVPTGDFPVLNCLVSDRQYQVSDCITLESLCLNFSQYQTFDAYV